MPRRWPPGLTLFTLLTMWVGGFFWLDDTARALEARQGVTLGSAFGRGFGVRWLSRWAEAMALETGMTPGAIKRRLLLFPVGIALIQRAVNRAPALPPARALPTASPRAGS